MLNPETEFRINSPQSSATAPATQPNKTPNVKLLSPSNGAVYTDTEDCEACAPAPLREIWLHFPDGLEQLRDATSGRLPQAYLTVFDRGVALHPSQHISEWSNLKPVALVEIPVDLDGASVNDTHVCEAFLTGQQISDGHYSVRLQILDAENEEALSIESQFFVVYPHSRSPRHRGRSAMLSHVWSGNDRGVSGVAQLAFLRSHGLLAVHHVLEIGCGALNLGMELMRFLLPNRYVCIEPNDWQIKSLNHTGDVKALLARSGSVFLNNVNFDASSLGRKFSFVISHSILSHAAAWQLEQYFENTAAVLERGGVSLASLIMGETDSNSAHWIYPGGTQFTAETIQRAAERVGVEIERMPWYTVMLRALTKHETHDWLKITRP